MISAKLFLLRHGIVRNHITRKNPAAADLYEIRSLWDLNNPAAAKLRNKEVKNGDCANCGQDVLARL